MKKNLIILGILFGVIFSFNFAVAATKYVPTPQQLQPSPPNVEPNLSGNINYIDKNSTEDSQQGGQADQNSVAPDSVKKSDQPFPDNIILLSSQNTTAGKISRWLLILGLAGAGTWLVKKRYEKK